VQAVFVPVLDSQGEPAALIQLEQPPFDLKSVFMQFIFGIVLTALLMSAVAMLLVYRAIHKSLIVPIDILNDSAKKIVSNLQNKEVTSIDIHTGDELEMLADSFSRMNLDLRDYIRKLSAVTAEKERIDAELELASEIQASFLPKLVPPYSDNKSFSLYGSMNPAKEVGGDFYDFFMVDDTHLALVIADVSGKGLPAALFMVVCKILIRDGFDESLSPAHVLDRVNSKLMENNETGFFATVWVAVIDLTTGEGVSVNAGHENPAYREGDYPFEYVRYKHSPPIAAMDILEFYERHFTLHPGDVLFVYTDGATDAMNVKKEQFGEDRLILAINKTRNLSLKEQVRAIEAEIDEFAGAEPQFDDITMLVFRYEGNGEGSRDLDEQETSSEHPEGSGSE
jgi:sigma-B regulation protein RsbU (phosphoserine phosphatase)